MIAGLSGLLLTSQLSTGDPTVGPGYLLPVIAAVFLGSSQFRGGRLNIWGTVVAAYTLAVGCEGLAAGGPAGLDSRLLQRCGPAHCGRPGCLAPDAHHDPYRIGSIPEAAPAGSSTGGSATAAWSRTRPPREQLMTPGPSKLIDPALFGKPWGTTRPAWPLSPRLPTTAKPAGFVGTFSSVSLDPPLVGVLPGPPARSASGQIRTALGVLRSTCWPPTRNQLVSPTGDRRERPSSTGWAGGPDHSARPCSMTRCRGSSHLRRTSARPVTIWIVLGRVHELAVGAFNPCPCCSSRAATDVSHPRSFIATAGRRISSRRPRWRRSIRSQVEEHQLPLAVNCSVLVEDRGRRGAGAGGESVGAGGRATNRSGTDSRSSRRSEPSS